jgi:hypothetical protein
MTPATRIARAELKSMLVASLAVETEKMTTKRVEKAARKFFAIIEPQVSWDYTDHKAKPLIIAAFSLYSQAWSIFSIGHWQWPFNELKERGGFQGDEPWTILLRRAVELAGHQ